MLDEVSVPASAEGKRYTFFPLSITDPCITSLRASYTLGAKHDRKMSTSIRLSTSVNIKLPTGARPFSRSSSIRLASLATASSRFAHLFNDAAPELEDCRRTSGSV